jgi:DNA-binding response OmpR family regulator
VLFTEDNASERYLLRPYLEAEHFVVREAEDARSALQRLATEKIDGMILDLNLPDEDGLVLLRKIRATSSIPVIAVTARKSDQDRIAGLEIGADDYLGKPYHPRELILRLQKLLARTRQRSQTPKLHHFGGFTLDTERHCLLDRDAHEITLTRGEFRLLAALARVKGRVLSRGQLLDAISCKEDAISDRTVDVLVSRIRRKIEPIPGKPTLLCTEKGYGYKLNLDSR